MEVSSTSGSSIVWSDDAKLLFVRLVAIDESNRSDKAEVFEGLYSLWKSNNNGKITVLIDSFIENKNFIKDMILSTLKIPKIKQKDTTQRIYDTLNLGIAFTTPEGNIDVEDLDDGEIEDILIRENEWDEDDIDEEQQEELDEFVKNFKPRVVFNISGECTDYE